MKNTISTTTKIVVIAVIVAVTVMFLVPAESAFANGGGGSGSKAQKSNPTSVANWLHQNNKNIFKPANTVCTKIDNNPKNIVTVTGGNPTAYGGTGYGGTGIGFGGQGGAGGAGGAGGSADATSTSTSYASGGTGGNVGDITVIGGDVRVPVGAAPIMGLRYITPPQGSDESITTSRFDDGAVELTSPQKMLNEVNVNRVILWVFGPLNWGEHFEMEPKVGVKSLKAIRMDDQVLLFNFADFNDITVDLGAGSTKVGEFHGWTRGKLLKDEEQFKKACAYRLATEYGANVFIAYGFSDDVNVGKSAVLGGGGVQVGRHSSGMSTGGFGTTESFVSDRVKGRVRGYYLQYEEFEELKKKMGLLR